MRVVQIFENDLAAINDIRKKRHSRSITISQSDPDMRTLFPVLGPFSGPRFWCFAFDSCVFDAQKVTKKCPDERADERTDGRTHTHRFG